MNHNGRISRSGFVLAIAMACALCFYDATPPQQVASVGPLLDSMATMCGEEFNAKRHKLTLDDKDNVTGCEVKP